VVSLEETKWSCDQRLWREVRGSGFGEFLALDVIGRAGGIVVGWKEDAFSLMDSTVGSHVVIVKLQRHRDNLCILFSSVYGPTDSMRRQALWEELGQVAAAHQGTPWLIGGDFNVTLLVEDRLDGRGGVDQGSEAFAGFVAA
jgi:hypothetical protein